jgi:two-component system cell cycle sensor histidine kinase/response regulator CckA
MDVTQALLHSLPEPHIVLARDLSCIAVNRPFLDLLHISSEFLLGKSIGSVWPSASRVCAASGEHTVELRSEDGRLVTARVACLVGEVIVVRVVASISQGESAQIHHKQRIETLGVLAGGIAHDFNNILTGILGHVAYMKHVLPDVPQALESLNAIEEGALRASTLTQQILKFSKLDSHEQSAPVDVSDLVPRIASILKSAIPSQVSLRVLPSRGEFQVLASEAHVTQILINLIINARDALVDSRGLIEVLLDYECAAEEVARLFGVEPAASRYGAIVVSDDGMGMSDEVKSRLFEPYFTTKNAAGTGLGLSTVHSIVKELGGAIEVRSQPGNGCSFRVVLPLVDDAPGASPEDDGRGLQRGRGERVLVIDDEYAVRNVLGLSLSHLGYEVETAASGLEGVQKFEQDPEGFRLVILDLLMPGLSGEEVFNRLRALRPSVAVLIVSGFSSEHVVQRILEDGGRDFIQKPFSMEVLSEKVRGCIRD